MNKNRLVILINKELGLTPLQALDKLREDRPELRNEKLSYAGRLDPMAEGLLLVLVGEENKDREKYLGLDKDYEVEILFGTETDTYDILGVNAACTLSLVANPPPLPPACQRLSLSGRRADKDNVQAALHTLIGELKLPYPPYSSKPVDGKPLFEWARSGKINEVEIPNQNSFINEIEIVDLYSKNKKELQNYILDSIKNVIGNFRQDEISNAWKNYFQREETPTEFTIAKIKVSCRSGAYMRSLAHELGRILGMGAIALSIKRTRIGDHILPNITI